MNNSYIGLGGNQGDVIATMHAALDALDQLADVRVSVLSHVFETSPVGARAGASFLNAVAAVEAELSPDQMLDQLQLIERRLGRRTSDRWTGRPIDLDLLLAGDRIIDTPHLTVPHQHLWYRRFVLDPLSEIAADVVHPVFGVSVGRLRTDLLRRPLPFVVAGGCAEDRLAAGSVLRREKIEVIPPDEVDEGPLRLQLVDAEAMTPCAGREIVLASLPGSFIEAIQSVVTAALDEPRVHKRPLRRMP